MSTSIAVTGTDNGRQVFPFAAIVGQEDLKTCLMLCAIDPSIGGVLIGGSKGTAKSTAARGLARLLPPIQVRYDPISGALDPYNRSEATFEEDNDENGNSKEILTPFVDLPIGATEDRVLGSLDFSRTLKNGGDRVFLPGLLAAANRGILYIDEVNLLPAHLVDILLDAAAMGMNTVQREGLSVSHPSKFMLIGTMNPEEGELRPQLLDRFGLMVDVRAPRDAALRSQVVRQRMSFEKDPNRFLTEWETAQSDLKDKIQHAKRLLPQVTMPETLMSLISQLCIDFEIDSLRADITLFKTATTLAALEGRLQVSPDDIRKASRWVLKHRRGQQSRGSSNSDQDFQDSLDQFMSSTNPPRHQPENHLPSPQDGNEQLHQPDNDMSPPPPPQEEDDHRGDCLQTFTASKPDQIKRLMLSKRQEGRPGNGRRNKVMNAPKRGYYVRSSPTDRPCDLALDATLRAAAVNGLNEENGQPIIHSSDWRKKVRHSSTGTFILFVVDASGSMAARQRMEAVKGAVLALLADAYHQRDSVGIISFRGLKGEVLLQPTNSLELAKKHLQRLPTGGRTPLAHALALAFDSMNTFLRSNPEQAALLIVLSDGKANVPLPESMSDSDPWVQTVQMASKLASLGTPTLLLDTEMGHVRIGRGQELAQHLNASYMQLDDLSADGLIHTIK